MRNATWADCGALGEGATAGAVDEVTGIAGCATEPPPPPPPLHPVAKTLAKAIAAKRARCMLGAPKGGDGDGHGYARVQPGPAGDRKRAGPSGNGSYHERCPGGGRDRRDAVA